MNLEDKKLGTLIGLAVGDAMGAPYEFQYRSHYTPTRGYILVNVYTLKTEI